MADMKDLRALSTDELRARLNDAREELMRLRFQQSTGELTDFTRLNISRKNIARILTLIGEHERKASKGGEA